MKNFTYLLILLTFYFTLSTFNISAQPTIQWENTYGGTSNETARCIIQTLDGGYIVAGGTSSNDGDVTINQGGTDCWLVKLDINGNKEWEKTYGGSGDEFVFSVTQMADSGYVLFATTNSTDGDISNALGSPDMWVIRVDKLGNIIWEKTYGGTGTDYLWKAINVSNGFVFCGYTDSNDGDVTFNQGGRDFWLVKIDTVGNILWQKTYGGSLSDIAFSVMQTPDNGYLVSGESNSSDGDVSGNNGISDVWIIKTDSLGNIEWQKNYGGSYGEVGKSCTMGVNGGYVVVGATFSDDGDVSNHFGTGNYYDYWVIKIDDVGNLEWEKNYGGTRSDEAVEILPYNGNYVVLGNINSSNGMISNFYGDTSLISPDYWLIQIDTVGNLLWEKNYGGSYGDNPFGIIINNNNSIVMTGSAGSVDYDVSGTNGAFDFWIVKLDPLTSVEEIIEQESFIYPNPTKGNFSIEIAKNSTLELFDIMGRQQLKTTLLKGINTIDVSNLSNGTYLLKVVTKTKIVSKKLIINH